MMETLVTRQSQRLSLLSLFLTIATLLPCVFAGAQERPVSPSASTTTSKTDAALYLLKTAEAEAQRFEGPMRAAVLFSLGRTYARIDQKKSDALLAESYDAVSRIPEETGPDIKALAIDIASTAARVAPAKVEHSLPSDPIVRDYALEEIVQHDVSQKRWVEAERVYERIETEPQVYSTAREFLQALPSTKTELANEVFFHALQVFGSQQHSEITAGQPEDLGSLLVRFYERFPRQTELQAVDELLRQAQPDNAPEHSQVRRSTIAVKTNEATVTFSSFYEFRLFQLLPIVRALDSQHADKLLADAQTVRPLLDKYPDGQRSIDPDYRAQGSNTDYSIVPLNGSSAGPVTAVVAISQMESIRISDQIVQKAETAPELAMPQADTAPLDIRVPALLGIARFYVKSRPSLAKEALNHVLAAVKDDATGFQWRGAQQAAELFLQMGDNSGARKACDQSSQLVAKIYKKDSDADDPNTALKLFWPSVHAWRDVIETVSKLGIDSTFDLLKEIPDGEIQVLEEVMIASEWVGAPVWRDFSPMTFHKSQ